MALDDIGYQVTVYIQNSKCLFIAIISTDSAVFEARLLHIIPFFIKLFYQINKNFNVEHLAPCIAFYYSRAAIHPYLILGLYQGRPPSAASRHLSFVADYLWRLKYSLFFTNLAAKGAKFEPLIAQILSAAQHLVNG